MRISGTGITSFQARILPDFEINTILAIKWFQTSDGNWKYVDRGSTVDAYETTVRMHRIKGSIEQVVTQFDQNRVTGSNVVVLSEFASNEHIFGTNLVYNSISATLLETPKVEQSDLKSFSLSLKLRAISPTFTGTATFPSLSFLRTGYDGNSADYTINKMDSYTGSYAYLDQQADNGEFRGTFQFTDTELKNLRAWMRVNRGTTIAIADIDGITYPFGGLRSTFPINAKVLELSGETMRDMVNWYATLRLVEVI